MTLEMECCEFLGDLHNLIRVSTWNNISLNTTDLLKYILKLSCIKEAGSAPGL